jgi:exoribonuclease R
MERIKFKCNDRQYEEWDLYNADTLNIVDKSLYIINPIANKLFNQDIILYDRHNGNVTNNVNNYVKILHSSIREIPEIPGVLILDDGKTYGKYKKKFFYRFIPDDKRIPIFLLAYAIKHIGFGKHHKNKYLIVKFNHWNDKHPVGTIVRVIGDVDVLTNFYEYQLYCKSLNASIQTFTKQALLVLRHKTEHQIINNIIQQYKLEDRRDWNVISIDPEDSKDFDDAFSIQKNDNETYLISIYISNVTIWMDIMNLWKSFSQRISTIYLPDRKRPMLPTILSDTFCSLVQHQTRFAFTLDITIKDNSIINTDILNTMISVKNNYRYNSVQLQEDTDYKMTYKLLYDMNQKNKNHRYISNKIKDSHDVVAYLMILMNSICAQKLSNSKSGLFRSIKLNLLGDIPSNLPDKVHKFIRGWNSTGGVYVNYENIEAHDIMKLDTYVHITSPIRRLVDLLNIMQLQHNIGIIYMNNDSKTFFEKWTNDASIEYINTCMRAIRKVQNTCKLLEMCTNNFEVLERIYEGYVFDKITRTDGLFQYLVYIPEINILNRLNSRVSLNNYDVNKYKLYIFKDEANVKQKVKLSLVE